MAKRARLHVSIAPSTRERLERYCEYHDDITMGDVVDAALQNFFDQKNRENSAPDFVLERINQLILSNMQIAQAIGQTNDNSKLVADDVSDLREMVIELYEKK